jgi:hypothetical protein
VVRFYFNQKFGGVGDGVSPEQALELGRIALKCGPRLSTRAARGKSLIAVCTGIITYQLAQIRIRKDSG